MQKSLFTQKSLNTNPISQITNSILGMFVSISMHLSWGFQILSQISIIFMFLKFGDILYLLVSGTVYGGTCRVVSACSRLCILVFCYWQVSRILSRSSLIFVRDAIMHFAKKYLYRLAMCCLFGVNDRPWLLNSEHPIIVPSETMLCTYMSKSSSKRALERKHRWLNFGLKVEFSWACVSILS